MEKGARFSVLDPPVAPQFVGGGRPPPGTAHDGDPPAYPTGMAAGAGVKGWKG